MAAADEDTEPVAEAALRPGERVGRYRVEERIGGGGMGVVYRATDTTLGRAVALKFVAAAHAGAPEARARLLREARAASALDHPHIGVVYEVGEHGGGQFIAMAFYDGETLRDRIARGPLPIDEAERIVRQLASALQAAHAAGITHRDVKPANVLVTRDGAVKLVDFGLAKRADAAAEALTASGALIGTLAYMAPEQLRGLAADARADLWALGVVAYEMLAGQPPFARTDRAALITAILTGEPPPVDEARAGLPPVLASLVEALLEKSPDDRVPSAAEVLARLDAAAPPPRRRRRRAGARRARALVAAAVLVAVLGGGAAWKWWPTAERRARAAFVRGAREFDLGHYDAALAAFEEAYRLTGQPELLFNAGQMYRLAGRPKEAARLYRHYLGARPNAPNRSVVEGFLRTLPASDGPR